MSTFTEYWQWRQLEPDVIVTGNYKSFYPADSYRPIAPVCPPESELKRFGRRWDDDNDIDNNLNDE